MVIKINYTSSDIYVSTNVSPVYVVVNYSAVNNGGGGSAVWGGITGTLSDQTDLQDALDDKVPYTGATTNVNLGEFELKAGQLTLDVSPTGTAAVGTTRWNDTIGSSETTLKGGSVILKNGVDLVARVVNKVSPNTTLTKAAYQAVRVSGAQGQRLAVAFAQANNDANSADTIGLVCETIATNQEGFIITVGQLENINTTGSLQGETWADGDVLYLSPTTPGAITKVKPTGNGHIVVIGYVEYAHANNGKIYVKVMNGWELTELHDCDIVTPANNEALIYESATSLWKNKTIATALGYTPVSGSGADGQVAYWNGTNSQTGSNNLFWDAANSRLGINTITPIRALDIRGAARIETASTTELDLIGGGGNIVRVSCSATTPFVGTLTTAPFGFFIGATERGRFSANGNLLVGSTTDGGQRLQVYGDAFIKGSGNTSATNALLVQNSAGTEILRVRNDSWLELSGDFKIDTDFRRIFAGVTRTAISRTSTGTSTIFYNALQLTSGNAAWSLYSDQTYTLTSGGINGLFVRNTFAPTSGTATFSNEISTIVNQTGGANGITRGLYVAPTLTAAADWRSIEWSNNSGWGLYGAGTSANYLGGNLSLSTTNTPRRLNINQALGGNCAMIGLYASGGDFVAAIGAQATTNNLQFASNVGILFYTNSTIGGIAVEPTNERMRLTTAGRLLLGTTTEGTFLLDVNGTARVSGTLTLTPATSDNAIVINNGGYIKYGTTVYVRGNATSYSVLDAGYASKFVLTWGGASSYFLTGGNYIFNGATAHASAMVQIDSTAQGFLPPRMTTTQKNAIGTPAAGLQVYDTTLNQMSYYNGTTWVNF